MIGNANLGEIVFTAIACIGVIIVVVSLVRTFGAYARTRKYRIAGRASRNFFVNDIISLIMFCIFIVFGIIAMKRPSLKLTPAVAELYHEKLADLRMLRDITVALFLGLEFALFVRVVMNFFDRKFIRNHLKKDDE